MIISVIRRDTDDKRISVNLETTAGRWAAEKFCKNTDGYLCSTEIKRK